MHRLRQFASPVALGRRRAGRAVAVAGVVVLAHAMVLNAALPSKPASTARAPTLDVRQIRVAEVTAPEVASVVVRPGAPQRRAAIARPNPKPVNATTSPTLAPVVSAVRPAMPADTTLLAPAPVPAIAPTRVPPSIELVFTLQRGPESGEARLSWQLDGERYALSLQATLPSGREVEQLSQGGLDASGLAPLRLADRRRGRDVRAANFQREHGKVTFSGPRWELPLEAGTQDRVSWLVQLVALAAGAADGLRDCSELAMWVVGARGAASHWRFEVRGAQRLLWTDRETDTLWLVREPVHPYDVRVEVWLDPKQGHWPLKLRQTQIPGGEPLEWVLRSAPRAEPGT